MIFKAMSMEITQGVNADKKQKKVHASTQTSAGGTSKVSEEPPGREEEHHERSQKQQRKCLEEGVSQCVRCCRKVNSDEALNTPDPGT